MSFTYAERDRIARWHEQHVLEQIRLRGSFAEPFGQILFSADLRDRLRACKTLAGRKTPVRWIPDIIVINGGVVSLVDAKAGDTWKATGNHDVEQDALTASLAWGWAMSCSAWFIFTDGWTASAHTLATSPLRREGPFLGKGSGTPFWLWPRTVCQELIDPTPPMPPAWDNTASALSAN